MKKYVFISLILCLCIACRSSQNTIDTSVQTESEEKKTEVVEENIKQEKQLLESKTTSSNTQINEKTLLVTYDPESGNVQSVQTTWRQTGRIELEDSSRQQSDVSRIERTRSIITHSLVKIKATEQKLSKSDSRSVQGIEWLWIILPIVIIIGIVYLIRNGKKNNDITHSSEY